MPITITVRGKEPLPTGEYRVELTAIELSTGQFGDQLKWTFRVLDKGRHLVAYSSISDSPDSKCMRWAGALMGRAVQLGEQVDFESLVGKTAIAVVVKQRRENGQEFNRVEELLPDTTNAADTST
jgi:hypothetical protein